MSEFESGLAELDDAWEKARNAQPRIPPWKLEVGVHEKIDFDKYTQIDAINFSRLRLAKFSPLHFRYRPGGEETPYFRFGSLVHAGQLEPDTLGKLYVVIPELQLIKEVGNDPKTKKPYASPTRTKKYKNLVEAFMAKHPGKVPVTQAMLDNLLGALKSVKRNPEAAKVFKQGKPEVTLIWEEEFRGIKLRCKARVDWLKRRVRDAADLKTTGNLQAWKLDTFDYHVQGSFYSRGLRKLIDERPWTYHLALVESQAPHASMCCPIGNEALLQGDKEVEFLLDRIAGCIKAKKWPGPSNPKFWALSKYYDRQAYLKHYG